MLIRLLRKELLAWAGQLGAAVTVLAQFSSEIVLPDWLVNLLAAWRQMQAALWKPVFDAAGLSLHPHIVAALSTAVFLAMIGIGARLSRAKTRRPLAPLEVRFLDDMGWMSVLIFAALVYVFLIGSGPDPAASVPLTLYGSELAGRYLFASIVTAGYVAGDFFGHRAFHYRLIRLAGAVGAVVAALWVLLPQAAPALPPSNSLNKTLP